MGTNSKRKGRIIRQSLVVVVFIALIISGIYGYFAWAAQSALIGTKFLNPSGSQSRTFYLEVAADDRTRALGLMWRKKLDSNGGMIFVYPAEMVHSFWMRNTYVSLDMVFIDKDNKVVGILEKVPILNETPRSVDAKSQIIIELAAGTVAKEGIKPGSKVIFEKALPITH